MSQSESSTYNARGHSGVVWAGKEISELETLVRAGIGDESLVIYLPTTLNLEGSVIRDAQHTFDATEETVILLGNKFEKRFSRRRDECGELPVSCHHLGKEVSIQSINIRFRPYDDPFTDRGVVWVVPGNPACVYFVLRVGPFKLCLDSLQLIVEAAMDAVQENVLKHFPTDNLQVVQ